MRLSLLPTALLLAAPAIAQEDRPVPRIIVSGVGTASTMPDRVAIAYTVHGEGATSDEAVSAVATKRRAIDGGLVRYAAKAEARAAQVMVSEVRGRDCNRYSNPRLSTGECAIIGYTADLNLEVRTSAVKDTGTIVGLIARLGGTNPRADRFFLADDAEARKSATADALATAKRQANAIAQGTGITLGRILSVSDSGGVIRPQDDLIVTTSAPTAPPPPPPPPPPPIALDLTPKPIGTQAHVQLVYAIQP